MFDVSVAPSQAGSHSTSPSGTGPDRVAMDAPLAGPWVDRLERTIQSEIVPRLLHSRRPTATASEIAPPRAYSDAEIGAFVAAILRDDEAVALQLLRSHVADGTPIETIYIDLMAPCARQLGTLWENDDCDFIEVTVAMGRLQQMLRELSRVFLSDLNRPDAIGSIVLSCLPGEQHTLGVIMVGEFLLRDGWRVQLGAPWGEHDLLTMVEHEWFDVVGFSLGCTTQEPLLTRQIRRLRAVSQNPALKIVVGGPCVALDPELAKRVGADAMALDAREAPRLARSLLQTATARAASDGPLASQGTMTCDPEDVRAID